MKRSLRECPEEAQSKVGVSFYAAALSLVVLAAASAV